MLEMGKFVPQVLRKLSVEWADDQGKGWEIEGALLCKQRGGSGRMRERREVG